MTDFYAAFSKPERPASTPTPVQAVNADRAGRYALAAFTAEVDAVRYAAEGGRNHRLNSAAYKLARFIGAGDLARGDVENALRSAALDCGLEPAEIDKTLASALGAGVENERVIPDLPEREDELSAWESYLREPLRQGVGSATSPKTSTNDATVSVTGAADSTSTSTGSAPVSTTSTPASEKSTTPSSTSSDVSTPSNASTPSPSGISGTSEFPDLSASPVGAASNDGTPPPFAPTTGLTPADVAWITDDRLKLAVVETQRRREAAQIVTALEAGKTFREPPSEFTLLDELALPDEERPWLIEHLIPEGGNVLLTAGFKTGKSTIVSNLARALADRTPFLGAFDIGEFSGRVGIWNYEIDRSQYRRWLRDIDFTHPENAATLPLRGYPMPLTVPHVASWAVHWLTERDVRVWIIDPFAPAFAGESENDNAEVTRWLNAVDAIQARAGVRALILPAHTGRPNEDPAVPERVRGATRLDDWADVRWSLTREGDERFFAATGRDVEVEEGRLDYTANTRSLRYVPGSRWETRRTRTDEVLIAACTKQQGCSERTLASVLATVGIGKGVPSTATKSAIEDAVARGALFVRAAEKRGQPAAYFTDRTFMAQPDPFAS